VDRHRLPVEMIEDPQIHLARLASPGCGAWGPRRRAAYRRRG
jgi:hypothetical protein